MTLAALTALFAVPGPMHQAAHGALHGLCAQQPTHTFTFDGQLLPFDARMTGIYGGLLLTLGWMAARGRLRCWAAPPSAVIVLLVALVSLMAVDGFNSLLVDLRLWHPYQPSNVLRLLTGLGAGIAMATLLAWLFATSVWSRGVSAAPIRSPREVLHVGLLTTPYAALVLIGPDWLFTPVVLLLLASAWLTLTLLLLVMAVLAIRRDGTFVSLAQLHLPVTGAALLALTFMLSLAGGRFWLERLLGIGTMM